MVASIPSPSSSGLHIGGFELHAYGVCYVFALLAAVALTRRRWAWAGGDPALVETIALWGFPAGLIGGRLYYLITTPGDSFDHWWGPLAIWQGGLGIWGGIALGTIVGVWRLRRAGVDVFAFMDAAAPGLLVAQAIGRVGNYFNQELFGGPSTLPWAVQISPGHRPDQYAATATFHPTFLYEIVWNLALAAALIALGRRRTIRPPGIFALYVAGYSAFRIFEETLRVDPAAHVLGLRWNLLLAVTLTCAGLAWFAVAQWRGATRTAPGRQPS